MDVLQRQSSYSAIVDGVQYSFRGPHHECLPVIFRLNYLLPFAMSRAFPGSDYYEISVAMGFSPLRQSRAPFDGGIGLLLISTYPHKRRAALKTALAVVMVVVGFALVVTLVLPAFVPVPDQFAESWVVGALFSSGLLFWSSVLFTGLVLAAVGAVALRILKERCIAFRRGG